VDSANRRFPRPRYARAACLQPSSRKLTSRAPALAERARELKQPGTRLGSPRRLRRPPQIESCGSCRTVCVVETVALQRGATVVHRPRHRTSNEGGFGMQRQGPATSSLTSTSSMTGESFRARGACSRLITSRNSDDPTPSACLRTGARPSGTSGHCGPRSSTGSRRIGQRGLRRHARSTFSRGACRRS
jgi:hypothetical protein